MKRDDKQNGLIHNNFYARIVIKFQDDLHLPYYREEEINDLLEIKWWDWEIEKITCNVQNLTDNNIEALKNLK